MAALGKPSAIFDQGADRSGSTAFPSARDSYRQITLDLAGDSGLDGIYRDALAETQRCLGISDRLRWNPSPALARAILNRQIQGSGFGAMAALADPSAIFDGGHNRPIKSDRLALT